MKRRLLTGAVLLLVLVSFTATDKKLTERERALHALNRLAFGPRPGDVPDLPAAVRYRRCQLHPDRRVGGGDFAQHRGQLAVRVHAQHHLDPHADRLPGLAGRSRLPIMRV